MYSHKLTVAGQVDCVAEYNGKLSVIDFKTANKERNESWIDNYFLQCTKNIIMYEEIFKKLIEQIVILLAGEDGSVVVIRKIEKTTKSPGKNIQDFYKYYEEITKDKIANTK